MATRIDVDDLPPKVAALLSGVETGEEVLLVHNGVVLRRLTVGEGAPSAKAQAEPAPAPEETAPKEQLGEIFEQFRSAIEDEF